MGFFRSGFLLIVGVLLLLSLFLSATFFTLSKSLEYENVQKEIPPLANQLASQQQKSLGDINIGEFDVDQVTEQANAFMTEYCKNHTEYNFTFEGKPISIPCSAAENGVEGVVNETLKDIVEEVYYAEYTCSFFKCLTSGQLPLVLVSKQAQEYWQQKFYFTLIAVLVLAVLAFFFVEKKLNWPILVGALLIVAVLPLLKIESIITFLIPNNLQILTIFLKIFFSKAYTVFWFSFVSGLIFIGAGFGLKVSNWEWVKKLGVKDKEKKTEKKDK